MELADPAFTEQEQEDYILLVLLGIINTRNLSVPYHFTVKDILDDALIRGFGDFAEDSIEGALFKELEKNVNSFTGAKQYQQVRDMEMFLGLNKDEFMKKARAIFKEYNEQWLSTEFDTVVNGAKSARDWTRFEKNKDTHPYLTYHTQRDSKVRPEHVTLEGITRRVDDPFWNFYTPPNGFNCRCFLTSSVRATVTPEKQLPLGALDDEIPDMFKFNPAKTGMVFSKLHPYFDIKRGDSALKRNNFNLAQ